MDEGHLEVYRSLNKHNVKYLLVGGMAEVLHGSPRVTKDVDVLTKIKGVTFKEGWKKKSIGKIGGAPIYMLGLSDLIRAKKASGREIDLQDVKILEEIKRLKKR